MAERSFPTTKIVGSTLTQVNGGAQSGSILKECYRLVPSTIPKKHALMSAGRTLIEAAVKGSDNV
jgi:hypothetical protein